MLYNKSQRLSVRASNKLRHFLEHWNNWTQHPNTTDDSRNPVQVIREVKAHSTSQGAMMLCSWEGNRKPGAK